MSRSILRRGGLALAGALAGVAVTVAPASAAPVVSELPLPAGMTYGTTTDINDGGVIVGGVSTDGGTQRAARWNLDGTVTVLQAVPGTSGGSVATAINRVGVIAGNSGVDAVWWGPSGSGRILPRLPGYSHMFALTINGGAVIAGEAWDAGTGARHAVRWSPSGVLTDLGTLPGDTVSLVEDINVYGTVVGWSVSPTRVEHAVRWLPNGTIQALPTLPGWTGSQARGINRSGVVVGMATLANGEYHAVRWAVDGTITDLGTLPGGFASVADAVNDAGAMAGTAQASGTRPARWAPDGTITDLGMPAGASEAWARAINNSGTIVGFSGSFGFTKPLRWTD